MARCDVANELTVQWPVSTPPTPRERALAAAVGDGDATVARHEVRPARDAPPNPWDAPRSTHPCARRRRHWPSHTRQRQHRIVDAHTTCVTKLVVVSSREVAEVEAATEVCARHPGARTLRDGKHTAATTAARPLMKTTTSAVNVSADCAACKREHTAAPSYHAATSQRVHAAAAPLAVAAAASPPSPNAATAFHCRPQSSGVRLAARSTREDFRVGVRLQAVSTRDATDLPLSGLPRAPTYHPTACIECREAMTAVESRSGKQQEREFLERCSVVPSSCSRKKCVTHEFLRLNRSNHGVCAPRQALRG